jgi:hypothetical protein
MQFPRMVRVRQHFDRPLIEDVPAAVSATLGRLDLGRTIKPGQTVALTAGSRGIANIPTILRAAADFVKRLGAKPFIVPAMGSHGGGTTEGQVKIINSYGITEESVGAPIRASMEVIDLGLSPEGIPVYLDKHASQADHIAVIGRIKPHTGYHGPIESGLLKMMMIGLGKHVGALAYHSILLERDYESVVRSVCRHMLRKARKAPIAFGLGIVENAYDETSLLEGVLPADFEKVEERLLEQAKKWLGRLPYFQADLLIVDEIGKDISGSGMDTNVVGRKRAFRGQPPSPEQPSMRLIFIRGLSEKTHGNATGVGLADFTTTRLTKAMNYRATVINCLTAGYPEGAFTPVHFETDREVVEAALKIIGPRRPEDARVMRIRHTLALEELEVSEALLGQASQNGKLQVIRGPEAMSFDASGNLPAI